MPNRFQHIIKAGPPLLTLSDFAMTPLEKFDQAAKTAGIPDALEELAEYFIQQTRFHELFEIRKTQLRWRLGLPVGQWQSIDDLPEATAKQLETGLLDACREVGTLFMQHGDAGIGWQYLQPVGDARHVRELLEKIEITDENVDAIVDVAVGHLIAPEYGYQLVLDRFGTCNAITIYESQLAMHPVGERRPVVALLVGHVYRELVERVWQSIVEVEPNANPTDSLINLIEGRDGLFEGLGHHIDTTHLASTVKFSRILEESAAIDQAIELAEYGRRLNPDFHYADQPPFENIYEDTLDFLRALRQINVESTVGRVANEARHQIDESSNIDAAQWYVYLLDQLGRGDAAISAYLELIQPNLHDSTMTQAIAPDLLSLAQKYKRFDLVNAKLFEQGDLLGYATSKAIEHQNL